MSLTIAQALHDGYAAGFRGASLINVVSIAEAESRLQPHGPDNLNRNAAGQVTSRDRGILQINSVYHPEVSDACAYNPQCAFNAAFRISNGGSDFSPWSTTHASGSTGPRYLAYVMPVWIAARNLGGPYHVAANGYGATASDVHSAIKDALNGGAMPVGWGDAASHAAQTAGTLGSQAIAGAITGAVHQAGMVLAGIALLGLGVFIIAHRQAEDAAKTIAEHSL